MALTADEKAKYTASIETLIDQLIDLKIAVATGSVPRVLLGGLATGDTFVSLLVGLAFDAGD